MPENVLNLSYCSLRSINSLQSGQANEFLKRQLFEVWGAFVHPNFKDYANIFWRCVGDRLVVMVKNRKRLNLSPPSKTKKEKRSFFIFKCHSMTSVLIFNIEPTYILITQNQSQVFFSFKSLS